MNTTNANKVTRGARPPPPANLKSTGEEPNKRQKTANDTSTKDAALPAAVAATTNEAAELWGQCLGQGPNYLTRDSKSWYIHVKHYMPTPSKEAFDAEWALCPAQRHQIHVFGRTIEEKRFSQSWGFSYAYSGSTNDARPLSESTVLPSLIAKINGMANSIRDIVGGEQQQVVNPYNGCLQNWYSPEDRIGLHADDERSLFQEYPIWSLSWGGPRRFLFRRKKAKEDPTHEKVVEVWLEDGDLLLMGGTCQETHKHEVPKVRKTMDPLAFNRINWTVRAFRTNMAQMMD